MARIGYLYGFWYDTCSILRKIVHIYYEVFKQTIFSSNFESCTNNTVSKILNTQMFIVHKC